MNMSAARVQAVTVLHQICLPWLCKLPTGFANWRRQEAALVLTHTALALPGSLTLPTVSAVFTLHNTC